MHTKIILSLCAPAPNSRSISVCDLRIAFGDLGNGVHRLCGCQKFPVSSRISGQSPEGVAERVEPGWSVLLRPDTRALNFDPNPVLFVNVLCLQTTENTLFFPRETESGQKALEYYLNFLQ
jgi:hypothetical protein